HRLFRLSGPQCQCPRFSSRLWSLLKSSPWQIRHTTTRRARRCARRTNETRLPGFHLSRDELLGPDCKPWHAEVSHRVARSGREERDRSSGKFFCCSCPPGVLHQVAV